MKPMLQQLSIENYALIRSLRISFDEGFTAITGETGAGKSIILGALGLLLGQRADTQVLSDKDRKCIVEAVFEVSGLGLEGYFADNDLDYDDNLLIRREIAPTGKSRAFVNDTPVQLQILKEIGLRIIDIHSQHQTLTLVNPDFQLQILDMLSGNADIRNGYSVEYQNYNTLKHDLSRLEELLVQGKKERDYNQFLFEELQNAQLVGNEQEELERELKLLSNAESIKEVFASVLQNADNQEDSVMPRLQSVKSQLSRISSYSPEIEELHKRVESCVIELRDIVSEVEKVDSDIVYLPQRQEEVSSRLDNIYRLQSKHSVNTVAELLEIQKRLDEKLQIVSNLDQDIENQKKRLAESESVLRELAGRLTASRKESAKGLEEQLLTILPNLGMKEARLAVVFRISEKFLPTGADEIAFLFSANRGGELREVGKVISGGELSRLMLAVKSLITKTNQLPTIIFDEIDTGVSGEISTKVARIMEDMSQTTQVMAITHLPQIAAKAKHHLKVFKQNSGETTHTSIVRLSSGQRVEEIAKMLSSDNVTQSALATAKELMS